MLGSSGGVEVQSIARGVVRSESDVTVRVTAVGLNALDFAMARGYGAAVLTPLRRGSPAVLGRELVGEVLRVGAAVMDLRVGDAVWAALDPWQRAGGALSEEVVVHESDASRRPRAWPEETAAGIPFAAMTVWRSVVEHARKNRARSALVAGARGNVGSVTVALLREFVPEMRRVEGIGRDEEQLRALEGEQFDVVVDAASSQGDPLDLARFVAPSGLYCSFNSPWMMLADRHGALPGSIRTAQELLEKKAQAWTQNGSHYKWGVMRAGGGRALDAIARAIDRQGPLAKTLADRPLEIVNSLEEAAKNWEDLATLKKKIVVKL